jgi:homopolymeric O-antigen transport system ATP-binding protein
MSDIAIKVSGLSKRYRIGANLQPARTLKEKLSLSAAAPFRTAKHLLTRNGNGNGTAAGSKVPERGDHSSLRTARGELIWALNDVSFEIKRGEVVGIIGRNGAGKSTLLKILSRITEPTEGYADIDGRVGSLLEVGTGFQPELTGRENIFLNGSILGMRNAEIKKRFDEIVAFAEVEKFIDTPVKHYSSGMYVRLAFAVAAHLNPEILLVDEVLAVGDVSFQKKCLGKMEDIGQQGRTVLFVSHSMQSISRLCNRTILLGDGKVIHDGHTHDVLSSYLGTGLGNAAAVEWPDASRAPGNEIVRLRSVRARGQNNVINAALDIREDIYLEMEYDVLTPSQVLLPNFHVYNDEGTCVFILAEFHTEWRRKPRPVGRYRSIARIPGNFLAEGTLVVGAAIATYVPFNVHLHERDLIAFQVVDTLEGNSARGDYAGHYPGVVRPVVDWTTEFNQTAELTTV